MVCSNNINLKGDDKKTRGNNNKHVNKIHKKNYINIFLQDEIQNNFFNLLILLL